MARSSTYNSAAGTLSSWLFAVVCLGGSVIYFDELRLVGRKIFGNPTVDVAAAGSTNGGALAGLEKSAAPQLSHGRVELMADERGHFLVDAELNGRFVEVMVDTGATTVAMSYEDAERAGIFVRSIDFTHTANTANGVSRIAPVKIDSISIGGITVRDVRGVVAEPGKLNGTLLGMAFLSRLSRAEMSRGRLILEE